MSTCVCTYVCTYEHVCVCVCTQNLDKIDSASIQILKIDPMNARITQFERLWATRPALPRIMSFEPEPELRMPSRDWLVRQTNEHERLSPRKKEQWWRAQTQA